MSKPALFISVKDLMLLHCSSSYEAMRRLHQTIRECLTSKRNKAQGRTKVYLTIREYCDFQDLNENEVLCFLEKCKSKPQSE
ncbi:MAG: hypothetical protein MUC87_20905 [Bacteroidia bacterium]|jgi:hypothetical protein|nr:hypothetical protein [Bacteroidia bacterium]